MVLDIIFLVQYQSPQPCEAVWQLHAVILLLTHKEMISLHPLAKTQVFNSNPFAIEISYPLIGWHITSPLSLGPGHSAYFVLW